MMIRLRRPTDSTGVPHASDRRVFTSTNATIDPRRGHEIEIMATPPKAVRLDVPATGGKVGQRDTLTREASPLPCVFPLCRGDESPHLEHG